MTVTTPMPQYKSHKKVWALKIAEVLIYYDGSALVTPADERYAPFTTEPGWGTTFKGSTGALGVYVRYKGGYESWSPTEAFDAGYSLIELPG
jgi:hypothetical protein